MTSDWGELSDIRSPNWGPCLGTTDLEPFPFSWCLAGKYSEMPLAFELSYDLEDELAKVS